MSSVEVAAGTKCSRRRPNNWGAETPADSSASGEADADTKTVMEDGGNGATTTPATDGEAAGARGDMGDTQAPAVSAQEEDVGVGRQGISGLFVVWLVLWMVGILSRRPVTDRRERQYLPLPLRFH
jgi:hypothetical protein